MYRKKLGEKIHISAIKNAISAEKLVGLVDATRKWWATSIAA